MNETKTCAYEGCNEPVNSPHDDEYCVFHAPVEKKGISVEEFNKKIFERINEIIEWNLNYLIDEKKIFDFHGYIFPGEIKFDKYNIIYRTILEFNQLANFVNAKFSGSVSFANIKFSKNVFFRNVYFLGETNFDNSKFFTEVDFSNSHFSGDTRFNYAQFSSDAFFRNALFSGFADFSDINVSGDSDFNGSCFSADLYFNYALIAGDIDLSEMSFSGKVTFNNTKFTGRAFFKESQFQDRADFSKVLFPGDSDFRDAKFSQKADFSETQFLGNVDFSNVKFSENAYFNQTQFNNKVVYSNLIIMKEINFTNITLSNKTRFYFKNPKFLIKESDQAKVIFNAVQFNPFAVYFEDIGNDEFKQHLLFIFRYCQLKDVYFTNNDMSYFSFFKSSFDQARFISCQWQKTSDKVLCFPFHRNSIIREELLFDDVNNNAKKRIKLLQEYEIRDLNSYQDIAALYRQMKTALDNIKDYEQSGWCYFNELEMKRREFYEYIKNNNSWFAGNLKKIFSKYAVYLCYKTFTGYGQKALWSFYWFSFFLIFIFTPLNYLINVHTIVEGRLQNHSLWDAFIFSLYRILPTNYVPFAKEFIVPANFWGLIVPFLNTLILIILIAFIGIGLKRHFRRF